MPYLISQNGEQLGPLDREEVLRRLVAGELKGSDLGWQEGMAEWEPLSKLIPPPVAASTPPPVFASSAPALPQASTGTSGLAIGTCSLCGGTVASRPTRTARDGGAQRSLDSPAALEKYRSYYSGDRKATFEAYVEVFFRLAGARNFPGGWTSFSRCANAEPALVRDAPNLVRRAEELMRLAGYEASDAGRPAKGRCWVKVD